MTTATEAIRNGVDRQKLFATLDLLKLQPELGTFEFRASNRWIAGAHNRSTIKGFYPAGAENETRGYEFVLASRGILLGTDTGPSPARIPAPRARRLPHHVDRARGRGAQGSRLTSVESTLAGEMNVRDAPGVDDEPRNGFERIGVSFRITGNAPEEKLREIVEPARARSVIYDMMRNGVPVALEVTTE